MALYRAPDRNGKALDGTARHTLAVELGRAADQEFHRALLAASGNAFLISLTSGIGAAVAWTTAFKHRTMALDRDAVPDSPSHV